MTSAGSRVLIRDMIYDHPTLTRNPYKGLYKPLSIPYQWGYDHPLAYGKQWEFTLNSHIRFHRKSFFNLSVPPLVSIHPPVQKTLEVQVLSILPVT